MSQGQAFVLCYRSNLSCPIWLAVVLGMVCGLAAAAVVQGLCKAEHSVNWYLGASNFAATQCVCTDSECYVSRCCFGVAAICCRATKVVFQGVHDQTRTEPLNVSPICFARTSVMCMCGILFIHVRTCVCLHAWRERRDRKWEVDVRSCAGLHLILILATGMGPG